MKTSKLFVVSSIVVTVVSMLTLTVGLTLAQGSDQPQGPTGTTAVVPGAIPVQGRLTDAGGAPLNGTYNLTFRLYDVETGGIALCTDTNSVTVQNGLFSSWIDYCYNGVLWGQKIWFSVQVVGDPEMTPRQVIYPVPYALGLVPGVVISASHASPFSVKTTSSSGTALEGIASSSTGTTYGVYGATSSASGYGGYFYNNSPSSGVGVSGISLGGPGVYAGSWGTALRATSATGVAIAAEGTGRITSTAKSYIWISGNDLRPYHQSDTTIIDADVVGGAKISPGATVGPKNVMLPVTIPAELYGQEVRVSDLDIDWVGSTDFDGISAVLLRRQTGVCETASCYASILHDDTDQVCTVSAHATGCRLHFDLTANNTLSADSGVLYLTIAVNFGGGTGWVEIGGVRLTLEHD
ncbi:hypothetical protein TFLX_01625 [Thermoflexales bacterium]|nr:hypothetical protein TFLX_01625 [Thermoflexales bacterium]